MAALPVPRAAVDAALAAVGAGASQSEAAAAHGISLATLKRYLRRAGGATAPSKPPSPPPRPSRVEAPMLPQEELPVGGGLLATLTEELRYASQQRRQATQDAARRAWSKRIEELVKLIDRIAPAPPPPPDLLLAELRRLDGDVLARIEEHAPEPISPAEVAA